MNCSNWARRSTGTGSTMRLAPILTRPGAEPDCRPAPLSAALRLPAGQWMAGLHLLKHMKGLSDEELCAAWVENPYMQAFCGEIHFQHQAPFDRSSMTRWRRRIGAKEMELLVAETIRVAHETGAVNERQLSRVTVDTTVQTKAVAHPTDSHLLLRATEWLGV